jgi:hypothetical protein
MRGFFRRRWNARCKASRLMNSSVWRAAMSCVAALSAGCLSQVVPPIPTDHVPDDASVRQMLGTRVFETAAFMRVNRAPYPSALTDSGAIDVNVYVSAADAPAYEELSPETQHEDVHIRPGMMVVREVKDPTGRTTRLTVMVRHSDDWFADGGDFLFGVTDTSGVPMTDPHDGSPQWGQLESCGTCHRQRAGDGWLFGVSQSAR